MNTFDIELVVDNFNKYKTTGELEPLSSIANEVSNTYFNTQEYIMEMAKTWDENIRFYEGDQYLTYNKGTHQYDTKPITKYNSYIPRPVSNIIMPSVNVMTSLLTRQDPDVLVVENSTAAEDINRARLIECLQDAKWEMDGESLNYVDSVKIAVLLGTSYRADKWNSNTIKRIPVKQEDGSIRYLPLGETSVEIKTPFEIIPDLVNGIKCLDDGLFVMEAGLCPVVSLKSEFKDKGDGYLGLGSKIQPDTNVSVVTNYLQRLKGSTAQGSSRDHTMIDNKSAVRMEVFVRPVPGNEKGIHVIVVNGKVQYINECKYTHEDGTNWNPYSMLRYERHPMRHYGISLVEQITSLQKTRNQIKALQILTRQTMAIPQWKAPLGSLPNDFYITGESGLVIPYMPGVNGSGPEKIQGLGLDGSVMQELNQVDQDIHSIVGDNEVLQGMRPEGVGTASALNILREQSYSKFNPNFKEMAQFIKTSQLKKLKNMNKFYREPRAELIGRVKAMNSDNTTVLINDTFTGKDMGNNIDIRVEVSGIIPKSQIVEQNTLKELASLGIFGPLDPTQNPLGNREFAAKFNIRQFPTPTSKDVDRAKYENSLLRQKRFEEVEIQTFDNPMIHYAVLVDEMKRDEFFYTNDEEIVMGYTNHMIEHYKLMTPEMKQMTGMSEIQIQQMDSQIEQIELAPTIEQRVQQLEMLAQQVQGAIAEGQAGQPDYSGVATAPVVEQDIGGSDYISSGETLNPQGGY